MSTHPLQHTVRGIVRNSDPNVGVLPGGWAEKLEGLLGYRMVEERNEHVTSSECWNPSVLDTFLFSVGQALVQYVQCNHPKRKLHLVQENFSAVVRHNDGIFQYQGPMPSKCGQMTRFAIAWWADGKGEKRISLWADRIHLTRPHVSAPGILPFGLAPFKAIFGDKSREFCTKCRKPMFCLKGIWKDEETYLCEMCCYEDEFGLRPGLHKILRK